MADKLTSILNKYVVQDDLNTKDKLLGASIVVVNKDGPILSASAGRTNLPHSTSPRFTDTSFAWVASMTKLLTAISALQLVDRKLVTLDEDLRPLVPEFAKLQILRGIDDAGGAAGAGATPILEPNASPITLRQLLTHTSGYAYDGIDENLTRWGQLTGTNQHGLTRAGFDTPLVFPPGDRGRWTYGTGIDWAGFVLERVTGKKLSEHMVEHLLGPLGITETTFYSKNVSPDLEARKVRLSYRSEDPNDESVRGTLTTGEVIIPLEFEKESGGAGLWTTAADYAKVLSAVLSNDGKILSPELVKEMFRPQLDEAQTETLKRLMRAEAGWSRGMAPEYEGVEDAGENFGLGGALNLKDLPGRRKGGSMMWSGMCNAHWWIDPESDMAGVLMVSVFPFGDEIVNKLYRELETAVYQEVGPKL